MPDPIADFCLLYTLRRTDVLEISQRLDEALDEDHLKNADMFDITRTAFSKSKHPNATMRALERDLLAADPPLLCMLVALTETGMELTQGLADLTSPADFAAVAAEIYENLQKRTPSAALLAQKLTEIKAEHARKRLNAAIKQMNLINRKDDAYENS